LRVANDSFRTLSTLHAFYIHWHYLCLWLYFLCCFVLLMLSLLLSWNGGSLDLLNQILSLFGNVCPELGIFALCWP
jgi:hypothetical protein